MMNYLKKISIVFLVVCFSFTSEKPPVLGDIFEGAYGWGSDWTFPAYTVRKVTNLNDSGTGSLRAAATAANTIVVFEVAGNIGLLTTLNIANNVYLATQTAYRYGGQGINIYKEGAWGSPLVVSTSYNIIRYTTISGYPNTVNCCSDTFRITGTNSIIDHNTFRYGNDEIIDILNADNFTFQYNIVSYALGQKDPDGTGSEASRGVLTSNTNNGTFLGNLFAENTTRNPILRGGTKQGRFEIYNNIMFNIASQGLSYSEGTEGNINVVGNYMKRGRQTQPSRWRFNYNTASLPAGAKVYGFENIDTEKRPSLSDPEINAWSDAGNSDVAMSGTRLASTAFAYPLTATYTALSPLQLTDSIIPHVGNSLYRDDIDQILFSEYALDRGHTVAPAPQEATGYFATPIPPRSGMTNIEADADGDGIPDSQEATWGNDTFGYVNSLVSTITVIENPPDPLPVIFSPKAVQKKKYVPWK